jgi:branched-chain amino acid transport system ATP-binding protein
MALLEVEDLESGYGPVRVLHRVGITAEEGEIVAVLGANGAGKSTLMRSIVGMISPTAGHVRFRGGEIRGLPAETIVRRGLTLVPEGRQVFGKLTVAENLRMGAYGRRDRSRVATQLDELLQRFPLLGERRDQRAGTLSGGEQQQLAICRALMSGASLVLLDEPSLGLAPVMVDRVFDVVKELRERDGLTVVLVEQSVSHALEIADRAYVLAGGRVTSSGTTAEMAGEVGALEASYLGEAAPAPEPGEASA